jgi:3-dehydroquinate synthase
MEKLYSACVNARLDRASTIIGIGGGVVTDMAGFLAATYMRGISFVSIPTTLLGMVDAAIGGKTGVDLAEGKNLVGAFWQPKLVWIDPSILKTLPEKEWRTGFAEIIKYGVIGSAPFFNWLAAQIKKNRNVTRWAPRDIERAIAVSAQMKARVVSGDERETPLGGGREILNFGHTTGHALEAALGFTGLTHGQAISIGMAAAGRVAIDLNLGWQALDHDRMVKLLRAYGLPTAFPRLSAAQNKKFWAAIAADKKNIGGGLRFVLPIRLGRVIVQSGIPPALLEDSLRELTI